MAPVQWDIMTELDKVNLQEPSPPECPPDKTFVSQELRRKVIQHVHSVLNSGHPGITATLHLLQKSFWWPTMRTDTIDFIHRCATCNKSKTPRQLPSGLLHPLPVPCRQWSHLAIDFITDLPKSNGNTTILTVIDCFSKACRLIPLSKQPSKPTAFETAESLCNFVFRFHGLPEDIVSDRGPQFTYRVWSAFFQKRNINISLTSGYHPQSNGQTEWLNQEITRFLRSYCQQNQADWSLCTSCGQSMLRTHFKNPQRD